MCVCAQVSKSNLQGKLPNLEIIEFQARLNQTPVNILLAVVRTVRSEQTELSLKPRRALAGIEFSKERREGRDEQGLEDSFEFSFTGDHSQDQAENFTDHSPPLPYHLVLSHPFIFRMKLSLFAPYLTDFEADQRIFPKIFSCQRADRIDFTNITKRNSQHCPRSTVN